MGPPATWVSALGQRPEGAKSPPPPPLGGCTQTTCRLEGKPLRLIADWRGSGAALGGLPPFLGLELQPGLRGGAGGDRGDGGAGSGLGHGGRVGECGQDKELQRPRFESVSLSGPQLIQWGQQRWPRKCDVLMSIP